MIDPTAQNVLLKLIVCYSKRDLVCKEEIEMHLSPLVRNGALSTWAMDRIAPGGVILAEFAEAVSEADVALILLSAALLDDASFQKRQISLLLRAQRESGLRLIPVLIRPCLWEMENSLGTLQPLPLDRVPLWSLSKQQRDQALVDLAQRLAMLPARPAQSRVSSVTPMVHPDTPYSRTAYLPRLELEARALHLLATPGQPVVLWSPERFGKSWLLRRLLDHVQEEDGLDARCTLIHLGKLLRESKDRESFYRGFAERMVDALDADPDYGTQWSRWVGDAWQQIGVPMRRLMSLARHHLLPRCPRRLVVALDAADEAIGSPWVKEFYGMLRGWSEAAHSTEFARLRIILSISTSPDRLIIDPKQSPFNVTQPLSVGPLDTRLLIELARRHWLQLNSDEVEHLRAQLGGHPYLSRLCLFVAARDGVKPAVLLDPAHSVNRSLFEPFLDNYRQWLSEEPVLLEALRAVAMGTRNHISSVHTDRLVRSGLLVRNGVTVKLFCPLFERLL